MKFYNVDNKTFETDFNAVTPNAVSINNSGSLV